MKTNLNSIYGTSSKLEKEGVWFDVSEGVGFLIARFDLESTTARALYNTHMKQYAPQIAAGTIDPKKEREVLTKIFVECSMIDWQGITGEDGKEIEFSKEAATKVLLELPDLADTLFAYARNFQNYKVLVGNS